MKRTTYGTTCMLLTVTLASQGLLMGTGAYAQELAESHFAQAALEESGQNDQIDADSEDTEAVQDSAGDEPSGAVITDNANESDADGTDENCVPAEPSALVAIDEDASEKAELENDPEGQPSDVGQLASAANDQSVTTASELAAAIADATCGDTIKLGADIDIDISATGRLEVARDITLDCNGFTLTVGGTNGGGAIVVNSGSTLTLVNAQTACKDGDNLIGENNGKVAVKSTAGEGVHAFDFIYSNNGTLLVESGYFNVESSFVDESKGPIEVVSGTFISGSYCFDDINSTLTIHEADVTAGGSTALYICDGGTLTIYGGTFRSLESEVISNYGKCYIYGGALEAVDDDTVSNSGSCVIYSGKLTAYDRCVDNSGTCTIYAGTFDSASGNAIDNSETCTIYGGEFTAPDDCVYNSGTCVIYTGTFTATDDSDGCLYGNGTWIVPDGYVADPADWQTSRPSVVTFREHVIKVNFFSEDALFTAVEGRPEKLALPDNPTHSQGYAFCYWQDADGNEVTDLSGLSDDTNLYAVYADHTYKVTFVDKGAETSQDVYFYTPLGEVSGLDRKASDDNFIGWKLDDDIVDESATQRVMSDLTLTAVYGNVVSNYDELIAALERKEPGIILGDDIQITATVEINHECVIEGNGHSLIRPDGFNGVLLEVKGEGARAVLRNVVVDGRSIDNSSTAIVADKGTTLILIGVTVKDNAAARYPSQGGAVFADDDTKLILRDCLLEGNSAQEGGGLYVQRCSGVTITDTVIRNNKADYSGGGLYPRSSIVHLHGKTSIVDNEALYGGGVFSSWGDSYNCILYMHDDSSISYNSAEKDGGGACLEEIALVMYDSSSIDHNHAGGNGGGVYADDYGIRQEGGAIRDNIADGKGGGVYANDWNNLFTKGGMFDNKAKEAGDDLYNNRMTSVYATQKSRTYGDGNSKTLGTVSVEEITDYYAVPEGEISVPWYGWFIDGEYDGDEVDRYESLTGGTVVSAENGNIGSLYNEPDCTAFKAIWYGLLLAYDANYEGTTEHQYDSQGYAPNTDATVRGCMFMREGYTFVGWNTKADGTGASYSAEDALLMDHSQVLYAQWEKNTEPTPDPDPDPDPDPTPDPEPTPDPDPDSDPTPDPEPEPKPAPVPDGTDETDGSGSNKKLPQMGDMTVGLLPAYSVGIAALACGVGLRLRFSRKRNDKKDE